MFLDAKGNVIPGKAPNLLWEFRNDSWYFAPSKWVLTKLF
jgi:hypothetical protein